MQSLGFVFLLCFLGPFIGNTHNYEVKSAIVIAIDFLRRTLLESGVD